MALVLSSATAAGQTGSFTDVTALQTLEERIRGRLSQTDTPGAAVALISREGLVWSGAIGVTDAGKQIPVTDTTLFRMGSISQMFVSLSILNLVEEGRLALHQSVADLAPDVQFENQWEDTHAVQLVHLLEHTTGFDDIHFRELAWNQVDPVGLQQALDYNPASRISRWPPGRYFSYSNSGAAFAAYILERVTGEGYESLVERTLFAPLDMGSATFDAGPQLAAGHSAGVPAPYRNILLRPSGALNATAREMGHLVEMLLNRGRFRGRAILSEESIQRMETPTSTRAAGDGIRVGPGLGTFSTSYRGFLWHGHRGEINGTLSLLQYVPAIGRGCVVVINSDSKEAMDSVTRLVQEHLLTGLSLPQLPPSQIPAWRLAGLAGYYRPLTLRREWDRALLNVSGVIRLELDGNRLRVAGTDSGRVLIPVTDRRFRGPEDLLPTASFHQEEGEIILQSFSRDFGGNYQAVAWWRVWLERLLAAGVLAVLASTLLSALVWIPRWILKRDPRHRSHMRLGVFPLLATLTLGAGLAWTYAGMQDPVHRLGLLTVYSGALFLTSTGFALLSLACALQTARSFRWEIDPWLRAYTLLVVLAVLTVTAYLWSYGLIGVRTWAS